jgi:uncharacterized protein YacL
MRIIKFVKYFTLVFGICVTVFAMYISVLANTYPRLVEFDIISGVSYIITAIILAIYFMIPEEEKREKTVDDSFRKQ